MNPHPPDQPDLKHLATLARESETRYRSLVDNTSDWIWEMDLDGKHTYSNHRLEAILGYTVDELPQLRLGDLLHPEDMKEVSEHLPRLIAEKRGWREWVVRFRHKEGGYRYLQSSAEPILGTQGAIHGFRGVDRDITERMGTHEALREERGFIDNVFDSITDLLFVIDLEDRLVRWNRRVAEVTGYTNAEIRAMAGEDFHSPEESVRRAEAIERLWRDGFAREELVVLTKDGRGIPYEFSASLLRDEDGDVVGYCGLARDISQAKQAELALRQSEEKFATVFRDNPSPLALTEIPTRTKSARFVEVNRVFEHVTSYRADEIVGREVSELGVWPDTADRERIIDLLDKDGMVQDLEIRFRIKSGDVLLCRYSAGIVHIGDQPFLLSSVIDITEQKRAENALVESETRCRQMFERNLAGVFRSTEDGRIVDCNDALAHTLGAASAQELLSCRAQDLYLSPSVREDFLSALRESGELHNFETTLRRIDGTMVHVLENVSLLSNGDGERYIEGTVIDITERRRLQGQLLHANKMEAIGRLAGGVAHDFNNLLTAIVGYAQLGAEELEPGDRLGDYFREVRKAGESAATLTRQLLAFSRQQELHPTVLDINEVIVSFSKLLERSMGNEVELVRVLDQRLGQVRADSGQVEQVLMNLAVNARDAMPDGGRLVIETSNVDLDTDYVSRHGVVKPGRYVMLEATDEGIGMDAETSSRIFEPFYTTKEQKGTGLGLATVYGIVKQSGGFIWVYSEVGQGTTFKIYLPRLDREGGEDSPAITQGSDLTGTETILLVDDEESIRQLAETVLESRGYTVLISADAEGALKWVEEYPGSIDLLLTDLVMPGDDGQKLAETVMELLPETKVLLMSGIAEHARLDDGSAARVPFLGKPFGSELLARKVREVLDSTSNGPEPERDQ